MKEAVLIYPHQLFEKSTLLTKDRLIFLVEDPLFFTQYRFHKQKLMLHRASMKAYQDALLEQGFAVMYVDSKLVIETGDIVPLLQKENVNKVFFYDLTDDWLSSKLSQALTKQSIVYQVEETPLFLTEKKDLDEYFLPKVKDNKTVLMHSFYIWQRKRLGILLEKDGAPTGGSWSYDKDNRKKLPKGEKLPEIPPTSLSEYVDEARVYVEKEFPKHYGKTDTFIYPVTHAEAKAWLSRFLCESLSSFGPYEDAVTKEHPFVYHSVLSPLLNNGLLDVKYVLEETIRFSEENKVHLPSLEGFIRQIIGWREYVRALYLYQGRTIRSRNYFKAERHIPETFWTAQTGIPPVDDTIVTALSYAYSHHIPRLMIMGNIMNLCGFHPDEVYRWFMEMYIDAYDWVMVPNVYSMALYADGGLITTKPYISSSRYVLSMSDYKKGEWSEIWDALFWHFVGSHFDLLSKENRLGFIGIMYSRFDKEKKDEYARVAKRFLLSLEG